MWPQDLMNSVWNVSGRSGVYISFTILDRYVSEVSHSTNRRHRNWYVSAVVGSAAIPRFPAPSIAFVVVML